MTALVIAAALILAVLLDGHRTRREIRHTALLAEEAARDAAWSARTAGLVANATTVRWRD